MKKAFTLIELLVVIAIIAILAALLMPALQRAREEANKTACRNNIHNVGIAFNLFLNDSKGVWPGWVSDWVETQAYFQAIKEARSTNGDYAYMFINKGYMDDVKLYDCPTSDNPSWGDWLGPEIVPPAAPDNQDDIGDAESVRYNEYAYDVGRISRNSVPGRVVYGDAPFRRGSPWLGETFDFNHRTGANVLFIDLAIDWTEVKRAEDAWTLPCGWGNWDRKGWFPNPRMDEDVNRARTYIRKGVMSGTVDYVESQLTDPNDMDDVYVVDGWSGWGWTDPHGFSYGLCDPTAPDGGGRSGDCWGNSKTGPEPESSWGTRAWHYWADINRRCFFPEAGPYADEPRWDMYDACLMPTSFTGVPGTW
jgi:prepilin-type N-terminal cleavage/methylation domain-containing protein